MFTSLSALLLLSLSHIKYRSITCLDQRHVHLALCSIITLSLSYKVPFNYLFRSKTCSPRSLLYYYSLSHIKYRSITCLDQGHVHLALCSIITLSLSYKVPFNYLFRSRTCSPRSLLYYYSLSLI